MTQLVARIGSRTTLIALLVLTAIVSGCTSTTPPSTPNTVNIQGYAFNPSTLTAKVGDTVTWKNMDYVAHTVTSDSGAFDSGTMSTGGSYSHTFDQAGTYAYHCTLHPSMKGTIIVQSQ